MCREWSGGAAVDGRFQVHGWRWGVAFHVARMSQLARSTGSEGRWGLGTAKGLGFLAPIGPGLRDGAGLRQAVGGT